MRLDSGRPEREDGLNPHAHTRTRVSDVHLWEVLRVGLSRPGRTMEWVQPPSHVGVEGNTRADLLADAGARLANPLPHHGQVPNAVPEEGNFPPKRRKVESVPSPPGADVLSASAAAAFLQSLGLEDMTDSPSDRSHACRGPKGRAWICTLDPPPTRHPLALTVPPLGRTRQGALALTYLI